MGVTLRPDAFQGWLALCADSLAAARAEIDALNVFPVPDGDTGTNAYLTWVAGVEAVRQQAGDAEFTVLVRAFADGLLTGANGNCGVILSQLVRAFVSGLKDTEVLDGPTVARCFADASTAAYQAVGRPVEGTILTVAAAAAEGAAAHGDHGVRAAFAGAAGAAREALARTPMQLERLAKAGVVDAGGRALVVVLDATEQWFTGRVPDQSPAMLPTPVMGAPSDDLVEGGPAYEVMFLLEAEDLRIPALRSALDGLGDSVVVVGGERLWNVHVHVDDVGAAIEVGIAAGRPYRVRVTHFADQIAQRSRTAHSRPSRSRHRVVLAAVTGEGMAELCRDADAHVLEFSRSRPLSADRLREALTDADADEVIVLPNNHRFHGLFDAAARQVRDDGTRVAVLPTYAQVQGLAALSVHDPGMGFDDAIVAMSSAAAGVRHGAVTIASEPGITMAGPCAAGDVLGVIAGEFAIVGSELMTVAATVVDRLLGPGSELVTLVTGAGAPAGLVDAVRAQVREARVDVDVVAVDGGQENYPLFIAVE